MSKYWVKNIIVVLYCNIRSTRLPKDTQPTLIQLPNHTFDAQINDFSHRLRQNDLNLPIAVKNRNVDILESKARLISGWLVSQMLCHSSEREKRKDSLGRGNHHLQRLYGPSNTCETNLCQSLKWRGSGCQGRLKYLSRTWLKLGTRIAVPLLTGLLEHGRYSLIDRPDKTKKIVYTYSTWFVKIGFLWSQSCPVKSQGQAVWLRRDPIVLPWVRFDDIQRWWRIAARLAFAIDSLHGCYQGLSKEKTLSSITGQNQ